ncbi:hypothetical protein [Streptomyces sp. NPDC048442]|uniref:hypothetical protein n=1 Tax=Streptomyces sp. NPDC048442 TaxID=3154823 RepID=UPI0034489C81
MSRATHTVALRTRNRTALCATGVALALALTGCASTSHTPDAKPTAAGSTEPSPPAAPSAAPSSADPLAAEKAHVVTTYGKYLTELARSYEGVDYKATDLRKYASGNALKQVHHDVQSLKGAGNHMTGAPTSSSKVSKISMGGALPTATLTSCLDVSHWDTVDKAGKALPPIPGQLKRYVTVSTFEKWPTGWMVLSEKAEARACTPDA